MNLGFDNSHSVNTVSLSLFLGYASLATILRADVMSFSLFVDILNGETRFRGAKPNKPNKKNSPRPSGFRRLEANKWAAQGHLPRRLGMPNKQKKVPVASYLHLNYCPASPLRY
jgi:hypothetical protein